MKYHALPVFLPNNIDLGTSETSIQVLEATPQRLKCPIQMSQVLPHVRFPIGEGDTGENASRLLAMVDIGAGLNCGRLQYHQDIAQKYPDLVVQFAALADLADAPHPFNVGGIGQEAGAVISHVTTYKTPYSLNGKKATVTFALGERVAANSILSYPFFKTIKASILLEAKSVVSGLLGDTYQIEDMVPLCTDAFPAVPDTIPTMALNIPRPSLLHSDATDSMQHELVCVVCLDIPMDIPMITKCSHVFCNTCIRQVLQYKHECPICRQRATEVAPFSGLSRRMWEQVKVKCPDCQWTGNIGNYQAHYARDCNALAAKADITEISGLKRKCEEM